MLIVGLLIAFAAPNYQKYTYRTRAAGVAVESVPIKRAIEEAQNRAGQQRLLLANATDGSIVGCHAPSGSSCGDSGVASSEIVVTPDKLLIADGTIRVLAAPCHVDCPAYALSFTSDLSTVPAASAPPPAPAPPPSTESAPAAPAGAAPSPDPGVSEKGAAKGKGTDTDTGQGKGKARLDLPLVSIAHAQSGDVRNPQHTNRVLYEFGELMRARVHAADNAACLLTTGPCTVTIKF